MPIDSIVKNAVLVGIQLPNVSPQELEGSLTELARLVSTLGYPVVGQVTQKRSSHRLASILGAGKLQELAEWTGGSGEIASRVQHKLTKAAEKRLELENKDESEDGDSSETSPEEGLEETKKIQVEYFASEENGQENNSEAPQSKLTDKQRGSAQIAIVDIELSPSQIRNLESAIGVTVLDRTGVIIEIFSRHARTKAARLQVEIARLTYVAPRLRETGGGEDRGGGGIGGKGAGESRIELDKRKIRDRIKELRTELASIGNEHQVRRARRSKEISVALVGYTNAGKSSLMRAMTGSDVLIADKLFATLDTTIRPMYPETRPKILISDTVGFIKKLPHDLVASFKSTLDEALNASLLLFVVDASDPSFRSQLEVTQATLTEVGANDVPRLLVLNKRDRLNSDQLSELVNEFPEAIIISTRDAEDVLNLREKILSYFEQDMLDEDIFVPYSAKGIVGDIRARLRVLNESYDENGVTYKLRGTPDSLAKLKKKLS